LANSIRAEKEASSKVFGLTEDVMLLTEAKNNLDNQLSASLGKNESLLTQVKRSRETISRLEE
jgi:hypothetical protein